MAIEFDPAKDAANIAKHGMSLADAAGMDLSASLVGQDDRFNYGEERFVAIGPIAGQVCVLIYTDRGENTRAISLRKASKKEIELWRGSPSS